MTLFEKSTSMQIIPFPAHYQSIYINFDISSFSLISYSRICMLLLLNMHAFTPQFTSYNTPFCTKTSAFTLKKHLFFMVI